MWLAAENGIFLRSTTGKWITTIPKSYSDAHVDVIQGCRSVEVGAVGVTKVI